jgi:hypothetical protein
VLRSSKAPVRIGPSVGPHTPLFRSILSLSHTRPLSLTHGRCQHQRLLHPPSAPSSFLGGHGPSVGPHTPLFRSTLSLSHTRPLSLSASPWPMPAQAPAAPSLRLLVVALCGPHLAWVVGPVRVRIVLALDPTRLSLSPLSVARHPTSLPHHLASTCCTLPPPPRRCSLWPAPRVGCRTPRARGCCCVVSSAPPARGPRWSSARPAAPRCACPAETRCPRRPAPHPPTHRETSAWRGWDELKSGGYGDRRHGTVQWDQRASRPPLGAASMRGVGDEQSHPAGLLALESWGEHSYLRRLSYM